MAVVAEQDSHATVGAEAGPTKPPGRRRGSGGWLLAVLGAVTVLLGLAIPLAPVMADDPVVSWPRAGEPATSTTLPLVPYRPLSLQAEVPCDALRAGGDALRTEPTSAGTPGRGLTVAATGGAP